MSRTSKTVHKRNALKGSRPLCWDNDGRSAIVADDIDAIDCVTCLRMLAKDAVVYGNGRRAKKNR